MYRSLIAANMFSSRRFIFYNLTIRRFSNDTTNVTKERIGFIGLGNMGSHQATNLIKKGYHLTVYDINKESMDKLVKYGAATAASPKEIAQQSDVIITMLPSSTFVEEVFCDKNTGILQALKSKTLCIDCSTIDPLSARQIAGKVIEVKDAEMVDSPVSGGTLGAEAATLTFMVGGPPTSFERAKPYLQAMGKNIIHCGDHGSGQVVKLCNNLILGISMVGVAEAMNLGTKLGVDAKVLASVINTSSGRCWSSDTYNPHPGVLQGAPSSRGYTGGFQTDLMKKDIGLAYQAAAKANLPLPCGHIAYILYSLLSEAGYAKKDFSSYEEFLQSVQPNQIEEKLYEYIKKN